MRVDMITVGMFQSNCYIVTCEDSREAIVIDAGDEGERILAFIEEHELAVKKIVNTHAHIDHVAALPVVAPALAVPVLMHKEELPLYENLDQQAATFGLVAPGSIRIESFLDAGQKITFGKLTAEVIRTPGHSPGGISLVFGDETPPRVFVGDVLFRGSIGRTDLFGSNHNQMLTTLRDVITKLPDDMVVYPGHGPETTIGLEKRTNPFLLELG